ncbi:hypothetical protein O1L60_00520 [Streptomyces diastatochromogenes]|nr:hypothetical protein [Streptomyces diastatochromogenes]
MKAVRFHSYGDADVLVHEEADVPRAGAGQVVLRVAGAAVNPVDASLRAGYVRRCSTWRCRTCRATTSPV